MTDPDHEALSRGVSDDMSPTAIERRLDIARQLYRLYQTLRPLARKEPGAEVREAAPRPDRPRT